MKDDAQLVPAQENRGIERLLSNSGGAERLLETAQPFLELIMHNECALKEIETKLNVLNDEFSLRHNYNPIESIKTRVKDPISIVEKMKRKGISPTIENIENTLNDIAGIRVICSFPQDIYALAQLLIEQDDVTLIRKKDYIANPKPNGYRSLHLIIGIPIFLSHGKKFMKVEAQFRTIAMDFWASLDHKMRYKQDIEHADEIARELKLCAEAINSIDYRMQDIRNRIEHEQHDGQN